MGILCVAGGTPHPTLVLWVTTALKPFSEGKEVSFRDPDNFSFDRRAVTVRSSSCLSDFADQTDFDQVIVYLLLQHFF